MEAPKTNEITLFDKICSGDIPADIIYEDDICLAIKDVNPQSKIHYLVIPKTKYKLRQLSLAT